MRHICNTTNYVCECNRMFNNETRHPQVSLIDMSDNSGCHNTATDCYAVILVNDGGNVSDLGRHYYDFSEAAMTFAVPANEIGLMQRGGKMLIFHPDIIRCTPLGMRIKDFSFFKYRPDEALHLSCCELKVIGRCLDGIDCELKWGVDEYSKAIISNSIELLLNYCQRFYTRQFITRHEANAAAIKTVDGIIDGFLRSGKAATQGMLTAGRIAPELKMSAEYLNDMMKRETGKNVSEYIQLRRILTAKELLLSTGMPIGDISSMLGFCAESCFTTVFKKITGCTPYEYRNG
ncbi:helix-turn-helix transcriptional regulator [uncultured Prevotella sp.]|uniref:helix-turn-helix domain-containing protein n=1 Tax=uncultured Prevotella sp. TaxID=159272 RepID=UPI0026364AF3|nr:helix-turn-helix transcriptional regulator [uncultured Prevotella sp.]